jgi:hypothetical protein
MLAIDTASTYPEIQLLYTGLMTPGKFATRSISLQQLILALLILQRISCPFKEAYPYDIYHEGDITLVTLGSVLARLLCKRGAIFLT